MIVDLGTTEDTAMKRTELAEVKNTKEPLLRPDDAALYLGFGSGWLAKLRMGSRGPRFIKLGRRIRYTRSDLDQWVEANRVRSTSERQPA